MTLEELRASCLEVIASPTREDVLLVVENRPPPSGVKARLFGRCGPLGEIVQYNPETRNLVGYWPAQAVLDYLEKYT